MVPFACSDILRCIFRPNAVRAQGPSLLAFRDTRGDLQAAIDRVRQTLAPHDIRDSLLVVFSEESRFFSLFRIIEVNVFFLGRRRGGGGNRPGDAIDSGRGSRLFLGCGPSRHRPQIAEPFL